MSHCLDRSREYSRKVLSNSQIQELSKNDVARWHNLKTRPAGRVELATPVVFLVTSTQKLTTDWRALKSASLMAIISLLSFFFLKFTTNYTWAFRRIIRNCSRNSGALWKAFWCNTLLVKTRLLKRHFWHQDLKTFCNSMYINFVHIIVQWNQISSKLILGF